MENEIKVGQENGSNVADIIKYLTATEEWNDIIIIDQNGDLNFMNSRLNTLDEMYVRTFKNDFK
jgi:hypothetical protein